MAYQFIVFDLAFIRKISKICFTVNANISLFNNKFLNIELYIFHIQCNI